MVDGKTQEKQRFIELPGPLTEKTEEPAFGDLLTELRNKRELELEEVSVATGFDVEVLETWEEGYMVPKPEEVDELCYYLGLAPDYFPRNSLHSDEHDRVVEMVRPLVKVIILVLRLFAVWVVCQVLGTVVAPLV